MWINVTIGPQRDILSLKTGLILGSGVLQVIITTVCYQLLVKGAVGDVGNAGQVLLENLTIWYVTSHEGQRNSGRSLIGPKATHLKQEMTWGGQTGNARQSGEVVPACFFFSGRSHSLARRCTTPGCERKEREEREWESQLEEGILGKSLPRPFQPSPLSTDIEPLWSFQTADSKLAVVTCRGLWVHWFAGYRRCFFFFFNCFYCHLRGKHPETFSDIMWYPSSVLCLSGGQKHVSGRMMLLHTCRRCK